MGITYNNKVGKRSDSGTQTYVDFASFPAQGAFDGQLAVDNQTNTLYLYDASTTSWVPVTGSSPNQYKPENVIILTTINISNKYIVLTEAPTVKSKTRVIVIGGPEQEYGVDFVVTNDDGGKRLSWAGLGLDGVLEVNDSIVVTYN